MSTAVRLSQRVGLLIDVQNLFYSAKNIKKGKVDYGNLMKEITGDRQLVRAIAYILQKEDVNQTGFQDALARMGYELKVKYTKVRDTPDGTKVKGSWSVGIAVDALLLADSLDTIIIASGDSDLVPLIQPLKSKGVRVEVYSFNESTSLALKDAADEFVQIPGSCVFKHDKFSNDNDDPRDNVREDGLGSTRSGAIDMSALPEDVDFAEMTT